MVKTFLDQQATKMVSQVARENGGSSQSACRRGLNPNAPTSRTTRTVEPRNLRRQRVICHTPIRENQSHTVVLKPSQRPDTAGRKIEVRRG